MPAPGFMQVCCAAGLLSLAVSAQQAPPDKPQVKVNILNVCTPSEDEKKELMAALSRLPVKAKFTPDFEIARGRTSASEPPAGVAEQVLPGALVTSNEISNWVRVRREFPADSPFISVQYTLSTSGRGAVETLAFRARDPKEILQMSLEAKVSTLDPATLLKTDTPAERIRVERYGKSSVALARCPTTDQSAYQSVFREGSLVLSRYRDALNVRQIVPVDLRRLDVIKDRSPVSRPKSAKPKPGPTAP